MLPNPTLSFTIPSIHDGAVLECRIYHPECLAPTSISQITSWRRKAAIVAHPYAPLGGSYDDAVVDLAASTILKESFVVGTFNFRGAGSSKGHTSWSSHPEQKDYMSFVGFMVYYMHYLTSPYSPLDQPLYTQSNPDLLDLSPIPSQSLVQPESSNGFPPSTAESPIENLSSKPLLLLAGYSYGSLITTSLPPSLLTILAPFQNPSSGTPYADIKSRARFLAQQQNESIEHAFSILRTSTHRRGRSLQLKDHLPNPKIRLSSSSVRMGGDEDIRRVSHDTHTHGHGHGPRRSFSVEAPRKVRRSVDRIRSMVSTPTRNQTFKTSNGGGNESKNVVQFEDPDAMVLGIGQDFKLVYLLISPLPPGGMISSLATIGNLKPAFLMGRQRQEGENDVKFTVDPTLVVHGLGDPFVGVKTFRRWTEKLSNMESRRDGDQVFKFEEIADGDHFWRNGDAAERLREAIREFLIGLPFC